MSLPFETYQSGEYFAKNPTWDLEDSSWKAEQVCRLLQRNGLVPRSIVEVGCGAGGILAALHETYPEVMFSGFEIAPDASRFWKAYEHKNISFQVDDFLTVQTPHFDVLLLLDVLEHVPDPFAFLRSLKGRANNYIFHFPLDLSAISVLREAPLLRVREKVGHIHYFTYVDGVPVDNIRTNHIFQGVWLNTKGIHDVEFRYRPKLTIAMLSLPYVILLLCIVIYLARYIGRKLCQRNDDNLFRQN